MYSSLINKSGICIGVVLSLCSFAFADDASVKDNYKDALALFAQRSATDSGPIDRALDALSQLEGRAGSNDLNYDVYILESEALYWKGMHQSDRDDKMNTHALGQEKAEKARALNPNFADAYYFAGINLARWGEAKGIMASLGRKGELIEYMNQAIAHRTHDGKSGESIDGYGPDRLFGRMYFKLPGIVGGSHSKSLQYLQTAYQNAKSTAQNVLFYADTLKSGRHNEKKQAIQILDEMLSQDPRTYNPDRIPETLEEFEMAKELRDSL